MTRGFTRRRLALAALAALALPYAATAQVIEIGEGGAMAVYDRPTVFTRGGARPIESDAPARGRTPLLRTEVHAAITEAANRTELDPALLEAVARQESGLRHLAISPAGAVGVMQLMPTTAAELGVDPFDLRQNVLGGAAYLRRQLEDFGGDLSLALAAYNAGPGAVRRFGGVPPFVETRAYVSAILGRLALNAVTPEVAP